MAWQLSHTAEYKGRPSKLALYYNSTESKRRTYAPGRAFGRADAADGGDAKWRLERPHGGANWDFNYRVSEK